MEKTDLFKRTGPADAVARDGYNAMLKGKMEVISGISPLFIHFLAMMPKKLVMRSIKKQQQVNV